MIPERILEPFSQVSFRSGLAIGALALVAGVVVGGLWRLRQGRPCPIAGLLAAAAGAAAVFQVQRPVSGLVAGLVALGGAGALVDGLPRLRPFLPLLALPGALVVATAVEVTQAWAPLAIGVAVAGGGALVADFDLRWSDPPLGPALVAVSLAGVFATVPETKEALPVLGAALPLVALGWPASLASLGAGGSLAATGLLAWTVAEGGTFRDSAIVGGLACLGMLVAEPLGRLMGGHRHRRRLPRPLGVLVAVALAHIVVVLVAARAAGLAGDLAPAVVIAALDLVAAAVASMAIRAAARTRFRAPSP